MRSTARRTRWLTSTCLFGALAGPGCTAAPAQNAAAPGAPPADAAGAHKFTVAPVTYEGHPAYWLTDGRTDAVVVPELGRVMRYGMVGGPNVLFNSTQKEFKAGDWKNWGGDKTWAAPQNWWPVMVGQGWPPDPAWDGSPQQAQVLPNGSLRTVSPISPGLGARVARAYWFNGAGDLVVSQTVEKVQGEPVMLAIWSVTQINPPDAVFLPLNPQSAYKENFHWIAPPANETPVVRTTPLVLQVRPLSTGTYKIGVDADVCSILAVKDGLAMRIRAPHPEGQYPDGASGHGFPVELWNNQDPAYNELEMLSPLQTLKSGGRYNYTMLWSLHPLAHKDVASPELRGEVETLLREPLDPALLAAPAASAAAGTAVTNAAPTPRPATGISGITDGNDFRLAAAPNPRLTQGTAGIIPIHPIQSVGLAVSVAQFARGIITHKKHWRVLDIYVFNDAASARAFHDYQARRGGRPLRAVDFRRLAALWPRVPVRYQVRGGHETVQYPAQNPRGFWR